MIRQRDARAIRILITDLAGRKLSICVQSALGTFAALAGEPEFADLIDDARAAAAAADDSDLANRLNSALEELDSEVQAGRVEMLAA